ncbi:5-methylcytosine-specific restriction endonuclease system specificity protein McrC [uncultured Methanobrevibacter sp.]|uniref:5-methylcytosine-specific restriction endonuclease system specificity protein McrC n=1 Tax=uncultured Methanobrevibacter sp. TaxID=253161 RepID=UPI0025EE6F08|nr:5-methylcytosine-specific restriction endonuclease system specificity protein McrC [uncultured Methanobrevibacter sp.]
MIAKQTIYINNIYHMLSYALRLPDIIGHEKIDVESFDNTAELLSYILIKGVSKQIKQGLIKDYIDFTEETSSIKGKININESINSLSIIKRKLSCTYDEFSVNCYLNQILKTTMMILIKIIDNTDIKAKLKNLLLYFNEVDLINVDYINWKIRYDRNNQTYQMLINVCYLIINGIIHTEKSGPYKLNEFGELKDSFLEGVYEKFILNYYKKEYAFKLSVGSHYIKWQLDSGEDSFLPNMITDVTLMHHDKILIIDAKFYGHNITENQKHHSGNLYQVFTYVKNKEAELHGNPHEVSGMLLYAMTDDGIQPDSDYIMSGNKISVKTLNLNQNFSEIKNQLDKIVDVYFEIGK